MQTLERPDWEARARAHAGRVDVFVQPHLERRRRGEAHPVHDFLFTYYSHRPAQLRTWHPGFGVRLDGADDYGRGYADGAVTPAFRDEKLPLVRDLHRLLSATASRPPTLGCFGLHEWAMAYRSEEHPTRHGQPLRLGAAGTDTVVETHRITCSHFDAFRFFTPPAVGLNQLAPRADDRPSFEQPGCLHGGMDLYKHAFRLSPLISSDLVADAFELAWDIRILDMEASPYDFAAIGFAPVRIETAEGKATYVARQKEFAERGAPIRQQLIEECERLLS